MLSRTKVIAALEQKRAQFVAYQAHQNTQRVRVDARLDKFLGMTGAEILARVAEREVAWPGALPTPEYDQATRLCLPLAQSWRTHEDARAWALEVLRDRPVAAVDGSQIMPTKEISLPVAAVQIGWFVNYHDGGRYEKDITFEVVAPGDLENAGAASDGEFPDWYVNQLRFEAECDRLCRLMREFASMPDANRPVCFFDGSLIISFASQLRPERAAPYLTAVRNLLAASTTLRMPLVGFVDSSGSRDLLTLVNTVTGPDHISLTDGALMAPCLPGWGDRSPLFICARKDNLSANDRADFYRQVAFTYVRLSSERAPARVELPLWLVDEGRAEAILDLVRAECVAGNGYPYVIETADAVAVIQQPDRERFYALLQQFAERESLPFIQSRKSLSKATRRS